MKTIYDLLRYLVDNANHPVDADRDAALALIDELEHGQPEPAHAAGAETVQGADGATWTPEES